VGYLLNYAVNFKNIRNNWNIMAEKEKTQENALQKEAGAKSPAEKADDESKEKILRMSEISLWLDDYDDLFSDFDPRSYSQRTLSDDFLSEAKKASRDKDPNKLEIRFLIAENKRDAKNEAVIKKRLHEHFNKHAALLLNEIKTARNKSIVAAFFGIMMMLGATYINSLEPATFASRFLFVLLEPAGWFVTWFALERLFYTTERKNAEYKFYHKMSKCGIIFSSY